MNIFDMDKNSLPEQVQINKENIKRLMDTASINSFVLRAAIADSFSELATYTTGALVWHNDSVDDIPEYYLYQANQNVSAGIWDESQWDIVKLKDLLDEKQDKADLFDKIYPVGSIYLSTNAVDPSTLFGGTWIQIKDKFLLAAGDNYTLGNTGGEATHQLTVSEMPTHRHKYAVNETGMGGNTIYNGPAYANKIEINNPVYDNDNYLATYVGNTGGNQEHNNMPPYLVVNVWERTA